MSRTIVDNITSLLRDLERTDFRGRPTLTDEGYVRVREELNVLGRDHPEAYKKATDSLAFERWSEQDERHSRTYNSY
jgi:hypothetical protein